VFTRVEKKKIISRPSGCGAGDQFPEVILELQPREFEYRYFMICKDCGYGEPFSLVDRIMGGRGD
jgi:hypothetical protein